MFKQSGIASIACMSAFFLPKHWGVALGLFIHLAPNLLAALVASTCGLPLPFSRLRHNFID